LVFAQSDDYWELYETYASADAMKYHSILQSLEEGDLLKAKEKLLLYQSAEILVLEHMRENRTIKSGSEKAIDIVREYNLQNAM
jgi:hypothetical protein